MKKLTIMIFVLAFALLNNVYGQDNKTVVITVSGDGPSKQEALQAALRNAIEQAFGTFISSNTQILNDELVKDEIVSIASGNIQDYTVLSEVQTPDGYWSNTVKAKVAIDKLTSFCESKGVNVEFKGSLFALNIKQQILNEENESKVIDDMAVVVKKILDKSFDYEISAGEPKNSVSDENKWQIPLSITIKTNTNIYNASKHIFNTLLGLSLKREEIQNYESLNKDYVAIAFAPVKNSGQENSVNKTEADKKKKKKKEPSIAQSNSGGSNVFYLRRKESIDKLVDLIFYLRKPLTSFYVYNDYEIMTGVSICGKSGSHIHVLFTDNWGDDAIIYTQSQGLFGNFNDIGCLYDTKRKYISYYGIRPEIIHKSNFSESFSNLGVLSRLDFLITFQQFTIGEPFASISFNDVKTVDELSKISGYSIAPFTSSPLDGTIESYTDTRDGRIYKTVKIGNQTWFAENLAYSNGDMKPYDSRDISHNEFVENPFYFGSYRSQSGFYDNHFNRGRSYPDYVKEKLKDGVFYNLKASHEACPVGWHLPSKTEFFDLIEYIAMVDYIDNNNGKALSEASILLKAKYAWEYEWPVDKYNFNAFPTGYVRLPFLEGWGDFAGWWTEDGDCFYLSNNNSDRHLYNSYRYFRQVNYKDAVPIRCLKD